MDRTNDEEIEAGDWEFIHNDNENENPIVELKNSDSDSSIIRSDHFSINPIQIHNIPNSISSSCSSNSEIDRNFDDSYVANQIYPNNLRRWNDSDSDSDVVSANNVAVAVIDDKEVVDEVVESGIDSAVVEEERKEDEKRLVWWKVPLEVLKHWVSPFSVVPIPLSVAAAAAFFGLLILGRRLYKMKRKTQTLKLNLALDDKKVSQLKDRVARLNEAFSVVRRIPVVRPSLPAASTITLRPVMSMR
ncbi:hypothetical protein MtrunA17_Chr3g0078021 [Medicago truncatula]|uniref:Transmembrane protein, putative n=1 Tax=Medicago truncatula TaxID=3880 RepID=A0A072V3S7_MEDTR|nr:uncharacterized protein LOC25488458 [Medicago truncatula]KEH32800.1 transmembrane protein, putative [Medicago truncatula]RHN65264.1 hypothetical protein MtrunA17_Chr3g0078021 [Medicago truncatula]